MIHRLDLSMPSLCGLHAVLGLSSLSSSKNRYYLFYVAAQLNVGLDIPVAECSIPNRRREHAFESRLQPFLMGIFVLSSVYYSDYLDIG